VEVMTGLLFMGIAHTTPPSWHALALTGLVSVLVALALIDLDTMLLPDDLTLPLMWAGLIYNALTGHITLADSFWGAIAGYTSLWLVFQIFLLLTGKEGMGFGDFKLLAAIGAWLGWQVLMPVVLLASLSGAAIGISLMVFKGHQRHQPIPFGPYLVIGGLMAVFCLKPGSMQWLNLLNVL
jgi:leader peptidase (prepilin peptidase)/N-methyltransferase